MQYSSVVVSGKAQVILRYYLPKPHIQMRAGLINPKSQLAKFFTTKGNRFINSIDKACGLVLA